MDQNEKTKRLNGYISTKTLEGFVVVDKNLDALMAVLKKEAKPINHILHLIITVLTCGLWGIVWAILYFTRETSTTIRVSIDESGNLLEEQVKS